MRKGGTTRDTGEHREKNTEQTLLCVDAEIPDVKMPGILANLGHLVVAKSVVPLDSGNVLRLPAFGAFGHVELHGLAFLQALEAASLNRGEMHENVFAILTADEAIAFGVVKPLHCSLFCH